MKKIFYFLLIGTLSFSCVAKKKFNELSQQLDDCNKKTELQAGEIALLEKDTVALKAIINRLTGEAESQSKIIEQNKSDIEELNKLNKQLSDQLKNSRSESEVKALLADIQKIQDKLLEREDALAKTEKELARSGKALSENERKLQELSNIIARQDSLMKNLRKKVAEALVGFEGNGLEVINKNGKVYVSLEEQLLFKSGRWDVDPKGAAALNNLAKFLGENKDIHVVIEGHTDDVPYNGSGNVIDNWDLSVKRATSIVRILLKNNEINPERITASGRAEFVPLDKAQTKEARQKNRRTEIILSPNMDELLRAISAE
jgi:chemotaxis protein MotB